MAESRQDQSQKAEEKAAAKVGGDEVKQQIDVDNERGYRGVEADPTPNDHYTLAGVVANKPTPETDPKQAEKASGHAAKIASKFGAPDA